MIKLKHILFVCILGFAYQSAKSQDDWIVPEAEKAKISRFLFEEELVQSGDISYQNSCISCHGTPSDGDFTLMVPMPGDPASEDFQNQTDGDLFYKIRTGRGSMPGFAEIYDDEELWNLIAYIRSFNNKYVQPAIVPSDVPVPELTMTLGYNEDVDKLVVKVYSEGELKEDVGVTAFVKGSFGNFPLGKSQSNYAGIAYFDVDSKMPVDSLGNLTMYVKARLGLASKKITQTIKIGTPVKSAGLLDGRHLWSVGAKAPIWLLGTFWSVIFIIWGFLVYILFGLRRIRKYGKE
jgi:hypothetical protein